jgi:NTE family protein
MMRSTSAVLDTASVRAVLDRPTARAVLSRFGASLPAEDGVDPDAGSDAVDSIDTEDIEPDAEASEPVEVPRLGSFEVLNRAVDIAQAALARHTLAAYPPDLLIEVPRTVCRSLEFHRAAEVIDVGRELTARALDG